MDALVTDTHTRTAIAGLRGLGRSGLRPAVLAPHGMAGGLHSRYGGAPFVGPGAVRDPEGFSTKVTSIAAERGPLVVYPAQEEAIDALYQQPAASCGSVRLPYPGWEQLCRLRDKRALPELASIVGIHTPRVLAEAPAAELAGAALAFPCVVKPAGKGGTLATARPLDDPGQLRRLMRNVPGDEPLIVQARLIGPMIALALVVDDAGGVVACFQQVALQTWPRDAGSTAYAVSVAPDESLVTRAAALLHEAGYVGLAQLQFLRDERGAVLIDVNTRFYGSMALALGCGVNLPAAWHALVSGTDPPPQRPYRAGVTYRWLEADIMAALRGSPRDLFRRAPSPRVGDVWARDDPLPGVFYGLEAASKRLVPRLRRLAGRARIGTRVTPPPG